MALIEVEKISKVYGMDGFETVALRDISFSVNEGEFAAIMGPSGSGKSTLLHILGFLDRATSGTYHFDGKTIDEYSEEELAVLRNKKIGFVFQSFHLLPRTSVIDNVKLPLLYSGIKEIYWNDMALEAIDSVGLSHRVNHEPSQLSGGEKQRVAIARALVNKPKLIFADEPTGNLDSKSGKAIMEILQDLNEKEGKTIILITHETYTAEHAERIIKILDGEVERDFKVDSRRKASIDFVK
ncbi:MAG: ABC transporter ATP-binding protein [Candidatus Colwellbacteria bacterium]|jgi:putative ABC transport system ATP-binding protein|nr:ABC transporter ATP-binding protein [Candidatus Colwellbacteria bacterium]MCK9497412.1 ABC transporter ATP-binding protein [Candidatus Colwellbacteria bacterium]MDD3752577.1 ABC transporter ATP-binding protein [Candidatus Colwellbacteria bacterium]MDD4818623.1 ABC transporter ATP-binding protein [Candidatus Colwellbacteria bacterium]